MILPPQGKFCRVWWPQDSGWSSWQTSDSRLWRSSGSNADLRAYEPHLSVSWGGNLTVRCAREPKILRHHFWVTRSSPKCGYIPRCMRVRPRPRWCEWGSWGAGPAVVCAEELQWCSTAVVWRHQSGSPYGSGIHTVKSVMQIFHIVTMVSLPSTTRTTPLLEFFGLILHILQVSSS